MEVECPLSNENESDNSKSYDTDLDYMLSGAGNLIIDEIKHFFWEDEANNYINEIFKECMENNDKKNDSLLCREDFPTHKQSDMLLN